MLDSKARNARFLADPQNWLIGLAPVAGSTMLSNPGVRTPGPLYTIFTWADAGGLLMDRLVAGIDRMVTRVDGGFLTDLSSISYMARSFGLSRAHASRKITEAESIGGISPVDSAGFSGRGTGSSKKRDRSIPSMFSPSGSLTRRRNFTTFS